MKTKYNLTENNLYKLREECSKGYDSEINYNAQKQLNENKGEPLGLNVNLFA